MLTAIGAPALVRGQDERRIRNSPRGKPQLARQLRAVVDAPVAHQHAETIRADKRLALEPVLGSHEAAAAGQGPRRPEPRRRPHHRRSPPTRTSSPPAPGRGARRRGRPPARRSRSIPAPIAVHTALSDHACSGRRSCRPRIDRELRQCLRSRYVGVTWLCPPPSWKAPLPASVFCNENRRITGLAQAGRTDLGRRLLRMRFGRLAVLIVACHFSSLHFLTRGKFQSRALVFGE